MTDVETQMATIKDLRGVRYVELFAVGPEVITIYNSLEKSDGPPELWDPLTEEQAAAELGVSTVIKNGPNWWASDQATLRFSIDEVTVSDITYRWAADVPAFLAKAGKLEPPFYTVVAANKEGSLFYEAGKPVYELVSPDGDNFIMQSGKYGPSEWETLGDRLDVADGWEWRVRTLEEDLTTTLDGKVPVVMDNLKNVYNYPLQPGAEEEAEAGEAKPLDVIIAVYTGAESAQGDFDTFVSLVEDEKIRTDGVLLVTRDENGEMQVQETGDHAGRKGAAIGGGVGVVLGLFAPPLLAATAVGAGAGALLGKFAKKHVTTGIATNLDEALPPGAAGIVAVYDHDDAGEVDRALGKAFVKSVGQMDKVSKDELQAGLEEAQAGLGM